MKKFLILLLSICMMATMFVACTDPNKGDSTGGSGSSGTSESIEVDAYHKITFKQANQADVVKEVKEGEALTDIPAPVAKEGYTVTWETVDLSNITADVIVNAVETANTYTVTYDANGGELSTTTQDVVYDSTVTLAVPTRTGYTFNGWLDSSDKVVADGQWKIADDVTLKASWTEILDKFTITFRQNGQDEIVFSDVVENSAFTEIPQTVAKAGYTVVWDAEDIAKLACVTENVVVESVETANTYTVTYDAKGGTVTPATQTVVFDSTPTLATPTKTGYKFGGWKYNGNDVYGAWKIADNVTLEASWLTLYTVTFQQSGQQPVEYTGIEEGTAFTKIPTPASKTGYTVAWDEAALAKLNSVSENVTVNAVEMAKTYTVKLTTAIGSVTNATITVTYDGNYTLETPVYNSDEYEFKGWYYKGQSVETSGTWKIDAENIELTAQWEEVGDWTGNY